MKTFLIVLLIIAGLIGLTVLLVIFLTPWMDRWGSTDSELSATLPGDELVPAPVAIYNHAISIHAPASSIYPWLAQLGAKRGGLYSYEKLENLVGCQMTNADRIHEEWQTIEVGDPVEMCAGDFGPPAYKIAQIYSGQALVVGHQKEDGNWEDSWAFVLLPQSDNTTRLVIRTRTMMVGGLWNIVHPIAFFMERGMLFGIKSRAELR